MHGLCVVALALEGYSHVLGVNLLSYEDYYSLGLALMEQVVDNLQFLRLIADVSALCYAFGRFIQGYFHLYGIGEDGLGQFHNLIGHSGREHQRLALTWQTLLNLHDIIVEAHVQHAVGLVEDEETDF